MENNKNGDVLTSEEGKYKKIVPPKLIKRFNKRLFDIILSGLAIIILLPFFLVFTCVVAIAMKGNPFFIQKRPGKNEKIFNMIKFRTMTNCKDGSGNLLPDELRLTKFGALIRKLSLDELPELFNIFIGQMSIVGPRPLLIQYLQLYNDYQKQRHLVRPGLTGLAQISGRNAISWEEKFDKDIEYIQKMSLFYDLKIILLTIKKVIKRDGINQEGSVSAEYFTGSQDHNGDN